MRPVRWLYSPVTDMIAMIGSTTESGIPIADANVSRSIAPSGAHRITAAVASTETMPTLAISQKPARVSNILRSSTFARRAVGIGRTARGAASAPAGVATGAAAVGVWVVVVMLLLLRGRSRR